MMEYQLNKNENIYTLNFVIPADTNLWVERYYSFIETAFRQEMKQFNKFHLNSTVYYIDDKGKYKTCMEYKFTVDDLIDELQVGHAADNFMILINWLYHLDYDSLFISRELTDDTIRQLYKKWKLTETSQIISKVGQCHFRLKLETGIDPLYDIFKFIHSKHLSRNYQYGIRFNQLIIM